MDVKALSFREMAPEDADAVDVLVERAEDPGLRGGRVPDRTPGADAQLAQQPHDLVVAFEHAVLGAYRAIVQIRGRVDGPKVHAVG